MAAKPQLVDLVECLRMLANEPGGPYGEYVAWFVERFGCSERAAKDALGVLNSAGYVDRQEDPADGRSRRYWPTPRAERLVQHPLAGVILRYARRLFSTCRSPSPTGLAERRASLERCESLLTGAFPLDLTHDLFLADFDVSADLPLPEVTTDPLAGPLQVFIANTRCKVCRSPFRTEVDLRIARGDSQASVRRYINGLLGSDYFTANNISRHVRGHFTEHAPELREALHHRLLHEKRQREAMITYLEETVAIGLAAIHAGVTQPTPRDLLQIVEYRESRRPMDAVAQDEYATLVSEFRMFVEAVREVVGEELFAEILIGYAARSATAKEYRDYQARRRLIEPGFSLA